MERQPVERAQGGDKTAFATLVGESIDRLHAVAQHILRDPDLAADATQEALVNVWRRLPQLRDPDRFEAWTYRMVVRAAYAEARHRTAWRVPRGTVGRVLPIPDQSAEVGNRDELERGFDKLSMDHRAIIVLKHYLGLNDHEIAEAIEIPEGTVRSRHFHALRALRAALEANKRDGGRIEQ